MEIRTGDIVRSFDFVGRDITGPNANYVLGIVTAVGWVPEFCDCLRYTIRVITWISDGRVADYTTNDAREVFPPVNGTPKLTGGATNGVQLVARNLLDSET